MRAVRGRRVTVGALLQGGVPPRAARRNPGNDVAARQAQSRDHGLGGQRIVGSRMQAQEHGSHD
jgi:hypothetical protein